MDIMDCKYMNPKINQQVLISNTSRVNHYATMFKEMWFLFKISQVQEQGTMSTRTIASKESCLLLSVPHDCIFSSSTFSSNALPSHFHHAFSWTPLHSSGSMCSTWCKMRKEIHRKKKGESVFPQINSLTKGIFLVCFTTNLISSYSVEYRSWI